MAIGLYRIDLTIQGFMAPESDQIEGFWPNGFYLSFIAMASSMEKAVEKADRMLGYYQQIAEEFGRVDKGDRVVTWVRDL